MARELSVSSREMMAAETTGWQTRGCRKACGGSRSGWRKVQSYARAHARYLVRGSLPEACREAAKAGLERGCKSQSVRHRLQLGRACLFYVKECEDCEAIAIRG